LEIQHHRIMWVGRFTIYVSFGWVQSGDHRSCEAYIVYQSHVNHRSLCHYLSRHFEREAISHEHWITLIDIYCKIHDSRQRSFTFTFLKLFKRRGFDDVPLTQVRCLKGSIVFLVLILCTFIICRKSAVKYRVHFYTVSLSIVSCIRSSTTLLMSFKNRRDIVQVNYCTD